MSTRTSPSRRRDGWRDAPLRLCSMLTPNHLSIHPPTRPCNHPTIHPPDPSSTPPCIYISQEELRAGFARYEFSALRLAFGLAGKLVGELVSKRTCKASAHTSLADAVDLLFQRRPSPSGARRHLEGGSAAAEEPRVSDAESASRLANADELFDLIDSDCSGEVDKREFTTHLSKAGYSMVTIAQIFHILDVNLDGLISRDEMRRSFMSYEYSALRLALGIKPSGVKAPA